MKHIEKLIKWCDTLEIMKKNTHKVHKLDYWKISTLLLLTIILICIISNKKGIYLPNEVNRKMTQPITPTINYFPKEIFTYPSNAFWLTQGTVTITSDDVLKDKFFTISLQSHPISLTPLPLRSYQIPLSNIDYISDPKISHNEKYGCVTIGASGYSGYYIFTLPDGKKVDEGLQYSQCVEWINDHEVIIVENIYNTSDITYYILDTDNKSKTIISTFTR